jgi:Fe-S cluster assembly protein SufD
MEVAIDNHLETLFQHQVEGPLSGFKKSAWDQFCQTGFPTRKDEEYKFTAIQQILKRGFEFETVKSDLAISSDQVKKHFYEIEGHHLVFVDGTYRKDLSKLTSTEVLIAGFDEMEPSDVSAILEKQQDDRSVVALAKAFASNGLIIRADKATPLLPIFIYHFRGSSVNSISFPFIHIEAETNAHLRVYERTINLGQGKNFSSHLTQVSVAKHGSVRYTKIQDHTTSDYTIDNFFVNQAEESHFYANTFSLSGALIRNNLEIAINGEHAEANMCGLYLLHGKSHVDNHTVVDHKFANCDSNELYKGIVEEDATGVFNGKIFVRQDAQKTNAFQSNNNILLTDTATIHTKPQLEIWADDVKCSHGCTVGQLDEEALFYLMSRGIRPNAAKAMLLNAFARESLDHVQLEIISNEITQLIHDRLDP